MRGSTLAAIRPSRREPAALTAIDGALAVAAYRTVFTCPSAVAVFEGVCSSIDDPGVCAAVRSCLDDALPHGGELVERSRVIDALLDARLLVASAG